jgi:hypothetical protein
VFSIKTHRYSKNLKILKIKEKNILYYEERRNLLYKSVVVFRVNLYVDDSSIWKISTEVAVKKIRQN